MAPPSGQSAVHHHVLHPVPVFVARSHLTPSAMFPGWRQCHPVVVTGIRRIPVPSYCSDVVCSDSYMVSGHHDKKIRFWDSRSQHCIREVTLEEKVTSLFMEPEQTQLLSCSRDDALSLIDLRMGSVRLVFRADGFKCGCDWTKAILSPDASYSMAGSSDGTIFIWSTRTGVLERSLTGEHSVAVNAVAWSVSGEYVVSVDRGKKAVLWSEY
ncbi:unnamed protein product [Ranitomeya imitator]|uniref:Uncharacterized protein n=1 Tax=Ranitomeya imitator TaxID=111125 RepID=A0ABN9L4Z8_9NEOB|nr:unnamed protein product [Ranitomeya imitator]